jgi:hypothetical protein
MTQPFDQEITALETRNAPTALTRANAQRASDDLARCLALKRALEAGKADDLKPLRERLDGQRRFWDALLERIGAIETTIKTTLLDWYRADERARIDAAQAAIDAERIVAAAEAQADAQAAGLPREQAEDLARVVGDQAALRAAELIAPSTPPTTIAGEHGRASIRIDWTFEITDEALVPREYLVIDTVTIARVVRATKDKTAIPGVRIIRRETIVGRSRP